MYYNIIYPIFLLYSSLLYWLLSYSNCIEILTLMEVIHTNLGTTGIYGLIYRFWDSDLLSYLSGICGLFLPSRLFGLFLYARTPFPYHGFLILVLFLVLVFFYMSPIKSFFYIFLFLSHVFFYFYVTS